jgi:UDPglucose 6-dehydrogenase
MKIAVAGAGYVGLSNAILLAQNHEVVIKEIDQKVKLINEKKSDKDIQEYLATKNLNLKALRPSGSLQRCKVCNNCNSNRL